jgi:nucleotide-binding universal stress UspA family protein
MGAVLCCVDDSEGSRGAARIGRRLAEKLGLELVLVYVAPPTQAPGVSAAPAGQQRLRDEELREADELLDRIAAEEQLDPGKTRRRAEIGRPAARILTACEEEDAELVVLGSRGRGGLRSAVLGSVSSEVATHAPCPCVIVPPSSLERPFLA